MWDLLVLHQKLGDSKRPSMSTDGNCFHDARRGDYGQDNQG